MNKKVDKSKPIDYIKVSSNGTFQINPNDLIKTNGFKDQIRKSSENAVKNKK